MHRRPNLAAETQNKRQLLLQLPLVLERMVTMIFSVLGTLDEILLAFGRLARVHRTSVLPQAKPRRRDGFAIPSSSIPKGGAGCQPAESTKKDICF